MMRVRHKDVIIGIILHQLLRCKDWGIMMVFLKLTPELFCGPPVSGCRFPIQQTGFGQHKYPGAYGCNVCPSTIMLFKPFDRLAFIFNSFVDIDLF
jgi:hypothetical protein